MYVATATEISYNLDNLTLSKAMTMLYTELAIIPALNRVSLNDGNFSSIGLIMLTL